MTDPSPLPPARPTGPVDPVGPAGAAGPAGSTDPTGAIGPVDFRRVRERAPGPDSAVPGLRVHPEWAEAWPWSSPMIYC